MKRQLLSTFAAVASLLNYAAPRRGRSKNSHTNTELQDQQNASKSKRIMRSDRGPQPHTVKARRYDRALSKARVASTARAARKKLRSY